MGEGRSTRGAGRPRIPRRCRSPRPRLQRALQELDRARQIFPACGFEGPLKHAQAIARLLPDTDVTRHFEDVTQIADGEINRTKEVEFRFGHLLRERDYFTHSTRIAQGCYVRVYAGVDWAANLIGASFFARSDDELGPPTERPFLNPDASVVARLVHFVCRSLGCLDRFRLGCEHGRVGAPEAIGPAVLCLTTL